MTTTDEQQGTLQLADTFTIAPVEFHQPLCFRGNPREIDGRNNELRALFIRVWDIAHGADEQVRSVLTEFGVFVYDIDPETGACVLVFPPTAAEEDEEGRRWAAKFPHGEDALPGSRMVDLDVAPAEMGH